MEHSVQRAGATPLDYIRYVAFEANLDSLRARRVRRRRIRRRSFLVRHAGVARTLAVLERFCYRVRKNFVWT